MCTHESKGTDLGSQSGRGSNLTSDGSEVDDLDGHDSEVQEESDERARAGQARGREWGEDG